MLLWCDPRLRMAAGEPGPPPQQPPLSHPCPQKLGGQQKHLLFAVLLTPRDNQLKQNHNKKIINKGEKKPSIHITGKIQFQLHKFRWMRQHKWVPRQCAFQQKKFTFSRYWMEFGRMNLKLSRRGRGKAKAFVCIRKLPQGCISLNFSCSNTTALSHTLFHFNIKGPLHHFCYKVT